MTGEFDLIERYFASAAAPAADVVLGLRPQGRDEYEGRGDDCALVRPPAANELLANSTDTLVEGVHFLADICPEDLAWRLVAASVSDLAAMGARPLWLSLAITLPNGDEQWLASFNRGLVAALNRYEITLIGGDTTSGPVRVLTAHVQGAVEQHNALLRSGARAGDLIYVSGTLGDSRAGLELLRSGRAAASDFLTERFLRPSARVELGRKLGGIATAAIDISDGLLADLGHLLKASELGARIELTRLPLSDALQVGWGRDQALEWAATGGEDFELCFTLPPHQQAVIEALALELDLPLTCIGQAQPEPGLEIEFDGVAWQGSAARGFDHFSGSGLTQPSNEQFAESSYAAPHTDSSAPPSEHSSKNTSKSPSKSPAERSKQLSAPLSDGAVDQLES